MISFETQYTLGVMMNVYHSSHFTDEETESLRVQMAVSCYPVTHSTARQDPRSASFSSKTEFVHHTMTKLYKKMNPSPDQGGSAGWASSCKGKRSSV